MLLSLMHFFVTKGEEEYLLTPIGYIVLIVLVILFLILPILLHNKKNQSLFDTKKLVFCSVCLALGMVTSMITLYSFPFGGSVTLLSMFFICFIGYLYGPAIGLTSAFAYGILQFIIKPQIYFPLQVLIDYPLGFGALGLSGLFWKSKNGLWKGYLVGIIGRYFFGVLSGWLFFGEYAWEGWNPLPYSLVYNACYIFTEGAITIFILCIPAMKKALEQVKKMANNTIV